LACLSSAPAIADQAGELGQLVDDGDVRVVQITPELVASTRGPRQPAVPPELLTYRPDSYRISPGDTIVVTVWDHPELMSASSSEGAARVNGRPVHPDGSFYYPYAGKFNVAGMRVEELRNVLTQKLSRYLQSPQVDVNVVGYGSRVTLQGAFVNTSPQDVTTVPLTLSQAVGSAVVNVEQADLAGLVLTRDGKSYTIDLDRLTRDSAAAPEIYLRPGDHLYLPFNDRKEVYVLGEVRQPQAITFKTSDLTLTQALGRAGGLDPVTAKKDAIYVVRGLDRTDGQPPTVYQLNAKSPAAFALADRFTVKPGDVVYVGPGGVTRWNRFFSQLLPFSGLVRNAANVPGN
jgi:polysaccharide export outer membrane protein